MPKEIRRYEETDEKGTHLVVEFSNGIKARHLKKPSKEYAAKMKKRAAVESERSEQEKAARELNKKVNAEIRNIAIERLTESGQITREEAERLKSGKP